MFFMMNPHESSSEKKKTFVGRLCGFRIHPSAIEIQLVITICSLSISYFNSQKNQTALDNPKKTAKITIKPPTKPQPSQDEPKAKIPATEAPAVDEVT